MLFCCVLSIVCKFLFRFFKMTFISEIIRSRSRDMQHHAYGNWKRKSLFSMIKNKMAALTIDTPLFKMIYMSTYYTR